MQKLSKDNYLVTLILIFLPLLFVVLSSFLNISNSFIQTISFLFITAIVIVAIYRVILFIFNKYPHFLETGLWKNKFFTFVVGATLLIVMIGLYIALFNNLSVQPLISQSLTILLAYPTVFILILLIYSFIKNFYAGTKESLLFVSSSSIFAILALLILITP